MGRTRLVMGVVAALTVVLVAPAVAQPAAQGGGDGQPTDVEPSEPATDDVASAELDALARARQAVGASMGRSASAEYVRRRAEAAVVDAHRGRMAALAHRDRVVELLDLARDDLYASRAEQRNAQEQFDAGVALSYKFGGAQSTALLLTAMQSAADVHDLARAVDELDNVLGHSYEELGRRTRAADAAEARVESLGHLRVVAEAVLQEATEVIVPLEEAAQAARVEAARREVAVLDAAAAALDAEEAVLDAIAEAEEDLEVEIEPPSPARDPLAPGTATVDEDDGPSVDLRREWLGDRRAVVAAALALPAEARWVQPELTCPVEGATFSNDFHFPRSHGRRHLGTDLFASRGTPIVALADGEVTKVDTTDHFDGDSDLGGVTVSWATEVGRFYAAHLERAADGLAVGDRVRAGDVVGYVGDSGNARGTDPHLHLGWYVDDVAINPWPTLALVCQDVDADDQSVK